jgi:hypothetical protein
MTFGFAAPEIIDHFFFHVYRNLLFSSFLPGTKKAGISAPCRIQTEGANMPAYQATGSMPRLMKTAGTPLPICPIRFTADYWG